MQQKIHLAPLRTDPLEDRLQLARAFDIAGQQQLAAERVGDRAD
jgi:hypothetical protein